MKILAIIRSSSERQETESQKQEIVQFCNEKGFNNDAIRIIEVQGASARKLNKKYIKMLEDVKNIILTDNEIKAVALWHLNRLGRVESKLMEMKEFFLNNNIQVYVKNPSLTLLNQDGTINSGAEISWSVFAVMIKQDTEEMFAKFSRAKRRNAAIGKYNGGTLKYGFSKDENDMVVINPSEAEVVRSIFEMYASGNYSDKSLTKELRARGLNFKQHNIFRMLRDTAYIGYTDDDKARSHRKYPIIVSEELFSKVQEQRKKANSAIIKSKRINFGIKLIKCPQCGGNYINNGGVYTCWRSHLNVGCNHNLSINIINMDALLWLVNNVWYKRYMEQSNDSIIKKAKKEISVLYQKIEVAKNSLVGINEKIEKVADNYVDGFISKDKRDSKIANIKKSANEIENSISYYNEEINRLNGIITQSTNKIDMTLNAITNVYDIQKQKELINDMIHLHTKSVELKRCYDENNKYYVEIKIVPNNTNNSIVTCKYYPNSKVRLKGLKDVYDRFFINGKSVTLLLRLTAKDLYLENK